MRTLSCLLIWMLLLPALRAAETVEQSFQAALLAEEARRDLDAAIRGYEAVVAQVDAQRALAATAVFRLGECYRKVGRTNDAVAQYQRLLRDFPTEATLTRLSRENLLALGAAPRASTSTNDEPVLLPTPTPTSLDEEQAEIARLRTLFDRSPDLMDAPVEDRTPLFQAATKGQLSVVNALIAWGADVNSNRSTSRETALHAAAGEGHKAVVEALLDAKANPNARSAQQRQGDNVIKARNLKNIAAGGTLDHAGCPVTVFGVDKINVTVGWFYDVRIRRDGRFQHEICSWLRFR